MRNAMLCRTVGLAAVAVAQNARWKIWTPGNTGTMGDHSFGILVDSAGAAGTVPSTEPV